MNINYSIDVTHPLIIHYDEEQYVPLDELPSEIRFSTTASGWDIFTKTNFINSSPIELELDDFKKRRYIAATRLKGIVTKQMHGIQINEILDDTIYVNFDKVKTVKIKLQVDSKKISLSEGYKLAGGILVEPSEVTISGPLSLVKKVPELVILKIEEKDISGKFDENISIRKSFDDKLKLSIEKVKVTFEAYQMERVEKELKLIKVDFPKKKAIKISDETVKLIYYVREEDVSIVEQQKMEAQVDFDDMSDNTKTIKVTLKKVPGLIQKYEFEPKSVKVSYGN